jgi:hypothetical protein
LSGKLVTLVSYDNVPLSEVARLRLEDAGIPVRVENADIVNAMWHVGPALGGVRLIVDEEHAAAAREVIADIHETSAFAPESDEDPPPPNCLACGAEFPANADRCAACGWSFEDGAEQESEPDADDADDLDVRAESVRNSVEPLKPRLSQVRDIGRPLVGIWVAIMVAGLVFSTLACAIAMLKDMFG